MNVRLLATYLVYPVIPLHAPSATALTMVAVSYG